jgi:glycosyltransferase involved in cell wall biosynthesis
MITTAPRPVLMIVHSYYDEDPRVRRQAEAIAATGRPVSVIGLRRDEDEPEGVLDGVRVVRLDVQRHQGAGLGTYLREYLSFLVRSGRTAWRLHRRQPVGLVQVHSLPDFLVFAALPLRLTGVPLILDLHEAMPELFRTRFPRAASRPVQWALRLQERVSIACSTITLSVNEARRERLLRLGEDPAKMVVVQNCPSLARFDPARFARRRFAEDGVIRLAYAGALTPTYEVDVAIRAMGRLVRARPDLRITLDVYGRGDTEDALAALVTAEGLDGAVRFHGRIPIDDVPAALARADIGLATTLLDPFTELSLSTKVYEYAAMEKAVVASRLPLVERTFPAGTIHTYEPGDDRSLAEALEHVIDDPGAREAAIAAAAVAVKAGAWETESVAYLELVDRLATTGPGRPATTAQATPSSR